MSSIADDLRARYSTIRFSSVYRSAPLERTDQSFFLNAVACFEIDESCEELHAVLQSLEKKYHKAPPYRFGPRTLDLDLLLFDDLVLPSLALWQEVYQLVELTDSRLFVPHLRLHRRRFVLEPLLELLPSSFVHPVFQRPYSSFLSEVSDQECTKIDLILFPFQSD